MRRNGVWYREGEVLVCSDVRSVAALGDGLIRIRLLGIRCSVGVWFGQPPATSNITRPDIPTRCGQ